MNPALPVCHVANSCQFIRATIPVPVYSWFEYVCCHAAPNHEAQEHESVECVSPPVWFFALRARASIPLSRPRKEQIISSFIKLFEVYLIKLCPVCASYSPFRKSVHFDFFPIKLFEV